jgi:hypothetical protein
MLKLLVSLVTPLLTLRVNEYVVEVTATSVLGVIYPEITPAVDTVSPVGNAPAIRVTTLTAEILGSA